MMEARNCIVCGRDYKPLRGNQKTCSIPCAKEKNRRRNNSLEFKARRRELTAAMICQKVCIICDAVFRARGNAKTCSVKCSKRRAADVQLKAYYTDPKYWDYSVRARLKMMAERKINPKKRQYYRDYHKEWQREQSEINPDFKRRKNVCAAKRRIKILATDPDYFKRQNREQSRKRNTLKAVTQLAKIAAQLESKK